MKTVFTTMLFSGALMATTLQAATVAEIRELSPQPGLQYKYVIDDLVAVPTAEEADAIRFTSGAHYYKQAITSTKPRINWKPPVG